jgi:hypothetical protein
LVSELIHPTEIAAYILINNILSLLHNKVLVGCLFCDLKKHLTM